MVVAVVVMVVVVVVMASLGACDVDGVDDPFHHMA